MVTLDAILREAGNHPYRKNTTILNEDQFYTIRGPSNPAVRARLDAAIAGSGDLIEVRQLNADEGLEVVEPVQAGIHGGYWYLRNLTSRGETFPAGESQYNSIVEALEAAIDWWHVETSYRGIMIRKYYVDQACDSTNPASHGGR
jgi:glutathionylspermidine synthase